MDRWGRGGASSFHCGFVIVAGEHGGEHPEHQRGLLGGDLQRLREHRGTHVPSVEVGLRCTVRCGGVIVAGEHGGERPKRQRGLLGGDLQRLCEHGDGRGRGGDVGAPRRLHESEGGREAIAGGEEASEGGGGGAAWQGGGRKKERAAA